MSLTPQDVERQVFRERRRGYDPEDVDQFLDQVAERLGELIRERDEAKERAARIERESEGSRESETLLRRTLLTAERTAEQTVAEAQEEADRLRAEAAHEAERMREEARRDAFEMVDGARSEADQLRRTTEEQTARAREMAKLGAEQVRRAVAELRTFRQDYRERVQAVIAEQVAALDRAGDLPDLDPIVEELAEIRVEESEEHAYPGRPGE